ncbi:MAG: alkaline phosphatase family protein [Deltaproteobacteria bacterium]|nr:alkaline phosphatase family protein [Deltaproteobacteria bacterium]
MDRARARRFAVAAFALGVGLSGHIHGHRLYLDRINAMPLARPRPAELPAARPPVPASRLAVIIIDGLGHSSAMEVADLRELTNRCPSRVLVPDFPSFTFPALMTAATGVPPRDSGVRINAPPPFPELDSVSRRAAEAGIVVRLAPQSFSELPALLQLPARWESLETEALISKLSSSERQLAWFYIGEVDEAGHRHGADSEEYRNAAREAGRLVLRVAGALERSGGGLERSSGALIVFSDHGHLRGGGHGGVEPEVMQAMLIACDGPFVRGLELPPAPMRNLASTLSWALGVDAPRSSTGQPMLDLFGLAAPTRDLAAELDENRARSEFERSVRPRVSFALIVSLAVFATAASLHHRRAIRLSLADAVPTILFLVGFGAPYLARGYTLSWSLPRGSAGFYGETLLFGGLGVALALWRARKDRRVEEAWLMALIFGLPYLLSSAWVGLDTTKLAGPGVSYSVILMATIEFYACLPFGLRALVAESELSENRD